MANSEKARAARQVAGKRRGVTAPLSRERIVAAALDQVAAEGLAGLSTRKIGERLRCEAMSIYHHFPSKQHLLDAMVDHAIATVDTPPADLTPLDRLRHAAHSYRAMANRFPALFPLVAVHRLNTPTGVRFIEAILALVQAVLPDPALSARHFRTLGYYLVGSGLDETSGYARGRRRPNRWTGCSSPASVRASWQWRPSSSTRTGTRLSSSASKRSWQRSHATRNDR